MCSSSSSSSRFPRSLHDVFLSFRGADTRNNFTSHLLEALNRQHFSTFRDDTKLRIGEDISSELLKAIEESRVSIVVFSKNYAASRWCLDELVKIMECRREFNRTVVPIFYNVDPSHVRAQLGSYSEAFAKHEGRFSMERVERWRAALTQAANLSGYNLQHGDETRLIKEVVNNIVKRLDRPYSHVANPVGIRSRVQKLTAELDLGSNDVRIFAIWGVGGIGKTTIAKAIFNDIRNMFDGSSFLADVSATAKESSGVVKLQKQLLSNILMDVMNDLDNYHQGIELIKHQLFHRRVLLVLDDVDHVEQLRMLAINRDFFGLGSRIIITTRNMTSLTTLQVNSVYSPKELNEEESLKLFSWNAFKTDYPEESHQKISNEIVSYAEGIPLVLEVLGSFLMGRSTAEWQSEFDKLKVIPNGDIQRKLKISFDSLDDKNQELFLDIVFFFIGRDKDFTVKVLEDSGCFPESGTGELARRCLIRFEGKMLRMHDMLRDMGREIVRQQSLKEPGQRSRLWDREEVLQVLSDCTGTKAVEGLSLELRASNNEHLDTKAFANMSNLRLLHLNYLQCLSGTYITTSRKLKWLCWHGFPFTYIPTALYMENLVAIDLQYSKLQQIWIGPKRLDKLRFLNLSHSYHLTETPNFSGQKSLEMLLLNDCKNLVKVHNSIGCLDKLLMLNMANCINLRKVPPSLFMLKSLEELDFSGCSKLGELAKCKGLSTMFSQWLTNRQEGEPISKTCVQGLSCIKFLNLARCNIEHVPSEIGSLITLQELDLSGNKFRSLPSSFSHLSRLHDLRLGHCDRLESLEDLPKNLRLLEANDCISLKSVSVNNYCPWNLQFKKCLKLLDNERLYNYLKRIYARQVPSLYYCLIYPGGELLNDLQFQIVGQERLSFVMPSPPLVGMKIIGLIVCAVVRNICDFEMLNETKRNNCYNNNCHIRTCDHRLFVFCPYTSDLIADEDHVFITYQPLNTRKFSLELEGGDKVDLSVCRYSDKVDYDLIANEVVKSFGFRFIYEDNDKNVESNIELISY